MINIEQRQLYFCFSTFWTLSGQLFSLNNSSCNQGWYLTTVDTWHAGNGGSVATAHPHTLVSQGVSFIFPCCGGCTCCPEYPSDLRSESWVLLTETTLRGQPSGAAVAEGRYLTRGHVLTGAAASKDRLKQRYKGGPRPVPGPEQALSKNVASYLFLLERIFSFKWSLWTGIGENTTVELTWCNSVYSFKRGSIWKINVSLRPLVRNWHTLGISCLK